MSSVNYYSFIFKYNNNDYKKLLNTVVDELQNEI